ncbi:hypothetical protein UlMin_042737 [Ulmus minor]
MAHSIEAPKSTLRNLVDALQALANTINSENPHIMITQFVQVPHRFDLSVLGIAFVYLNWHVEEKVNIILKDSTPEETVQAILEREIAAGTAKKKNSRSINIVRMTRMIEMAKIVFQQIKINEGPDSIIDPMIAAYDQVFAPYHEPNAKEEVHSKLKEFCPPKSTFFNTILKGDENLAQEILGNYIAASEVVIKYIQDVFMSTEVGAQLLRQI